MDPVAFRRALGTFPTGVTIVTTAHDGVRVGLTASSFNSVALSPPLVLWSLHKQARCMSLFVGSKFFAIHVLSADQLSLSQRFAAPAIDRFHGLDCDFGVGGVPLIPSCCARFECRKVYEYEGGDHTIFVGEVVQFESSDKEPLVFKKGGYAIARPHPAAWNDPLDQFANDVMSLLGRCYQQVNVPFRRKIEQTGMDVAAAKVLALLSSRNPPRLRLSDLNSIFPDVDRSIVEKLVAAGMIRIQGTDSETSMQLLALGSATIAPILAAAFDVEERARGTLGEEAYWELRALLLALLQGTGSRTGGVGSSDLAGASSHT
jgi:3-hydroxy-9,10-secoandrosta-1,3,5(10)-triene-9,17-dione monooxygenase reductase component